MILCRQHPTLLTSLAPNQGENAMRVLLTVSLCLFISLLTCNAFCDNNRPASINRIIVFGDSLSDTGNDYDFSYLFRGIILKIPSLAKEFPQGLIPSPFNSPYYNGRFSDGKNWLEDFANLFHIKDTERHHFGALENFAYGGAWASPYTNQGKLAITVFPLDLYEQLLQYQVEHPLPYLNNNHVLAIVFIGANDYLATDTKTPKQTQVNHVVTTIIHVIKALHNVHRITHFLVMGMPNLAGTPYAAHLPQSEKTLLQNLSLMHNNQLQQAIEALNNSGSKNLPYHVTFINWLNDHQALNTNYKKFHFRFGQNEPCHDFYPATVPMHIPLSPQKLFLELLHHNTSSNINLTISQIPPYPSQVPHQLIDAKRCDDGSPSSSHVYMDDVHPTRLAQCIIALRTCEKMQTQYAWQDAWGHSHPLNCGINSKTNTLKQAADLCYTALQQGDLRQDTLLPFE